MIKNRLQHYMYKEDINISQLSERTDISRNTLSSLINKGSELTAFKTKTLETICAYFGITLNDLLIYIDESIKLKNISSLTPEKKFEETPDKKRFYDYLIQFSLENSFNRVYEMKAKVSCSTGFRTDFIYNDSNNDEQFSYNLYEIEIDEKFPKQQKNSISEDNIRNLMIYTEFFARNIFLYIPDLLDQEFLNLSKTPVSKIRFKYLSYSLDSATHESNYYLFITEEKELKFLPIA